MRGGWIQAELFLGIRFVASIVSIRRITPDTYLLLDFKERLANFFPTELRVLG